MLGPTGIRLVETGSKGSVTAPQNMVQVQFPQLTNIASEQLTDAMGCPIYRKDIVTNE